MISVSKVPQLCSLIPHLAAGPANDLAARAHFASADLSEAARWAQAAWALRHVMTWATWNAPSNSSRSNRVGLRSGGAAGEQRSAFR